MLLRNGKFIPPFVMLHETQPLYVLLGLQNSTRMGPLSQVMRLPLNSPGAPPLKKGRQWYSAMKAHIGVDSRTKLVHSVAATAANVHDSQVLPQQLHGRETRVWGDACPQSYEVESPCDSRVCVLGEQADLWVVQSPLPRAGEEYPRGCSSVGGWRICTWLDGACWRWTSGCECE